MQNLTLHAEGQNQLLEILLKKFKALIAGVKLNTELNKIEKTKELERLKETFETEKRNLKNNLY